MSKIFFFSAIRYPKFFLPRVNLIGLQKPMGEIGSPKKKFFVVLTNFLIERISRKGECHGGLQGWGLLCLTPKYGPKESPGKLKILLRKQHYVGPIKIFFKKSNKFIYILEMENIKSHIIFAADYDYQWIIFINLI